MHNPDNASAEVADQYDEVSQVRPGPGVAGTMEANVPAALPKEKSAQPYDQSKAFNRTPASTARRLKNLQNQAQALNMKLVPA